MKLGRLTLIFALGSWLLVSTASREALAKKVVIEWKPMDQALRYELVVEGEGKAVLKKTLEDTRWKGDLPTGAYTYQVRGIDKINRPGQWSEWKSLAVMPLPPQSQYPPDGATVDLYHSNAPIPLRWEPSPGVKSYVVEVTRGGQLVSKQTINGTQTQLRSIPDGKYTWQIRPLLQLGSGAPANLRGKSWESPRAEKGDFEIRHRTLDKPVQSYPLGSIAPTEDRILKLRWEEVEGAEGYLVHIAKVGVNHAGSAAAAASDLAKAKTYFTKDNKWAVRVAGEGSYVWGVRALAHLGEAPLGGNLDPSTGAQGPEAATRFSLDRNSVFTSDLGYIAVSTMLAPYTYQLSSPLNNIQGSTSASALVFRLSGEYWLKPLWAIALAADFATFQMGGQSFSRPTLELNTKFRTKLSSGMFGWSFSPKIGGELRGYNYILPTNTSSISATGLTGKDIMVFGAAAGFDLRKQLSESFSLGIKASYFYPVGLFASSGTASSLAPDASYRNFSVGVQGLYWINHSFGLGIGGYFENRSIGFLTPGGPTEAEKVYMDGMYFFGSLVYRIWR